MSISVACGCGKRMKAKDAHAGRVFRCPGCGGELTVPNPLSAEVVVGGGLVPAEMRAGPTPPEAGEPWFFGALELYARTTLWIGGGVFALGLILLLFVLVSALVGPAARADVPGGLVVGQAFEDIALPGPARRPPSFAVATAASALLGISLFGLFTMFVPSLLILLAVQAARDLRAIRAQARTG